MLRRLYVIISLTILQGKCNNWHFLELLFSFNTFLYNRRYLTVHTFVIFLKFGFKSDISQKFDRI